MEHFDRLSCGSANIRRGSLFHNYNPFMVEMLKNVGRYIWWVLVLSAAMTLGGCDLDEPEPVPEPSTSVGRAVLVYMVANNSLGSAGYDTSDFDEMDIAASAGALGSNRLIVYHHAYHTAPELVEVTPSGHVELKEYDTEISSVSAERMETVIADFKELAPAESYGIVLWSHASGWLENGIMEDQGNSSGVRPKAFGEDGGKKMNVTTLARVLDGKGFDYVYFDCCHMAGVEVAYQLRNVTSLVVGSVAELPSAGMPYDRTLPFLMADEADMVGAASTTFEYYNSLSSWQRTCTMSVISTEGMDRLADAVGKLCDLHPVLPSDFEVQRFIKSNTRYIDLKNYLEALGSTSAEASAAYEKAAAAIDDVVLYQAATPYLWQDIRTDEVKVDFHCGLSTNLLTSRDDASTFGYNRLGWWNDVMSRLFMENDITE